MKQAILSSFATVSAFFPVATFAQTVSTYGSSSMQSGTGGVIPGSLPSTGAADDPVLMLFLAVAALVALRFAANWGQRRTADLPGDRALEE